jgi:hypothetical protein
MHSPVFFTARRGKGEWDPAELGGAVCVCVRTGGGGQG